MSLVVAPVSIAKALEAAEKFVGESLNWASPNPDTSLSLHVISGMKQSLPLIPEARGWADVSAEVLNQILEREGKSIRLQPWPADGKTFGVVGISQVVVEWPVVAQTIVGTRQLLIQGKPAFRLGIRDGVSFFASRFHRAPIVCLRTKSEDRVFITMHEQPLTWLGLNNFISMVKRDRQALSGEAFDGVDIPMVHLYQAGELGWLKGAEAQTASDKWRITQAMQEVEFTLNQHGAVVKEAAAMAMTRGMSTYYTVDGPFVIWIERHGVDRPIFGAWVTEEDWKQAPGA